MFSAPVFHDCSHAAGATAGVGGLCDMCRHLCHQHEQRQRPRRAQASAEGRGLPGRWPASMPGGGQAERVQNAGNYSHCSCRCG